MYSKIHRTIRRKEERGKDLRLFDQMQQGRRIENSGSRRSINFRIPGRDDT